MFCDNCDRGYHSYCVGLSEIPKGLSLVIFTIFCGGN